MDYAINLGTFVPQTVPQKMSGKLTSKIIIKKDYIRVDGTSALFVQIYMDGKRKRIPLNINVPIKDFSETKQRIKGTSKEVKDYNIYIEKVLAGLHNIELEYRLRDQYLNIDILLREFKDPSPKIDFLKFYKNELEKQKLILKPGTHRQQTSSYNKLLKWRKSILFQEINQDLINELISYCRNALKNGDNTIFSTLKNFKKYLHMANKKGIATDLKFDEIKVRSFKSHRTYLDKDEINKLHKYYSSEFLNETHKNILQRFLFSCFTGLRISDMQKIERKNISNNVLFFTADKTNKIQRISLNRSAQKFINKDTSDLFTGNYTNEHINRVLKEIAKICGIRKRVSFHVSRHTFATQFILSGGDVVNLQDALGHSNIRETMIYVHLVKAVTDEQIGLLDNILN